MLIIIVASVHVENIVPSLQKHALERPSSTVNNDGFEGYARVIDDKEPELVSSVSSLMNKKYGWSDGLIVELNPK